MYHIVVITLVHPTGTTREPLLVQTSPCGCALRGSGTERLRCRYRPGICSQGCSKTVCELEDDLCDQRGIYRSREDDELPRPKSFDTGLTLLKFGRVTTYMVMEKRGPAIIARAHLAVSSW